MITRIAVRANKRCVHINYDQSDLCMGKYMVRTNRVRIIKRKQLGVINVCAAMDITE